MLYLFDLDGTLISRYLDNPDRGFHTWQPLPGRVSAIQKLKRSHQIAIVTNQAGVAFGHIDEQDVIRKLGQVAILFGYPAVAVHDGRSDGPLAAGYGEALDCYVCYSDPRSRAPGYRTPADIERRKPSGAMIREAMADQGLTDEDAGEVIFVGDRPEDGAAARDAGVRFVWAEEFFDQ